MLSLNAVYILVRPDGTKIPYSKVYQTQSGAELGRNAVINSAVMDAVLENQVPGVDYRHFGAVQGYKGISAKLDPMRCEAISMEKRVALKNKFDEISATIVIRAVPT